jgi:hypothetical protein
MLLYTQLQLGQMYQFPMNIDYSDSIHLFYDDQTYFLSNDFTLDYIVLPQIEKSIHDISLLLLLYSVCLKVINLKKLKELHSWWRTKRVHRNYTRRYYKTKAIRS